MEVHKSPVLSVFDAKQRLEVPLFQRQYVWSEEQQWLPLWEDVSRKFVEALEGRKDGPQHFLGAMVLDQKQTPTGHVVVRQVIDGQQRLTTLQIFLAAYRDFCLAQGCDPLAGECDKFSLNTGMMSDPDVDKFKVWPTQLDRSQFKDVVTTRSREEILKRHPLRRRPYAKKYDPRPRMVEAYLFFYEQLREFFLGDEDAEPLAQDVPIATRADECFQTLRNALMVVVIDLQKEDDPQIIFETLNARGEPLLPADLLRNFIFLRVAREKVNVEDTYQKYWSSFDDQFWREEVKQGRLIRPRSDLFMQHFLASRQGQDVPIKHLYVEYRHWIERHQPFPDVITELKVLARQGKHFRQIISPARTDRVFEICAFMEAFDIRTAYPLLLAMMDADLDDCQWREITIILESYLLRRAICQLTTKNYNRIFLGLTRILKEAAYAPAALRKQLMLQTGDSAAWPEDEAFKNAWLHKEQYGALNNPKLVHIFSRLNQTFMSSKSETINFEEQPSIEHIMPQGWMNNWPLPDGSRGIEFLELPSTPANDPRPKATQSRSTAVQTLGNLTILSSGLNSAQSTLIGRGNARR